MHSLQCGEPLGFCQFLKAIKTIRVHARGRIDCPLSVHKLDDSCHRSIDFSHLTTVWRVRSSCELIEQVCEWLDREQGISFNALVVLDSDLIHQARTDGDYADYGKEIQIEDFLA